VGSADWTDRLGPRHRVSWEVEVRHDRVVLTRHGRPAAVIISPDELESLEETLELLSDPRALRELREAEAAVEAGEVTTADELRSTCLKSTQCGRGSGPCEVARGTLRGTQTPTIATDPSARSGPPHGPGAGQRTWADTVDCRTESPKR
jgi:prevent-host-death family protein